MKKLTTLLFFALLLSACGVDTTGISPASSKKPQGNANASVIVQVYSDFQCPACRVAHSLIVQPLLQKYKTQISFEFVQFPLMTIHPLALPFAEASECAADQGKFWEFVDMAFERQLRMDKEQKTATAADIQTWARDLNLDLSLFDRCTTSRIKRKAVLAEFEAGRKLDVGGTPTFFVNGQKIEKNDLGVLSAAVDAALAKNTGRKL